MTKASLIPKSELFCTTTSETAKATSEYRGQVNVIVHHFPTFFIIALIVDCAITNTLAIMC